jgi:hypothetical protein
MMGGSKNGAASVAAPSAGSRRVVGTIAEAAAIARAGARHEPPSPPRESARRDRRPVRAERDASHESAPAERHAAPRSESPEDPAPHRTRAVDAAEVQGADGTVTHHILAERAYAYGRSIVEAGPEPKKPGETVEIES